MIDFIKAKLTSCVVQAVGNKSTGEEIRLSKEELPLTGDLAEQLSQYFLKPFKNMNEVYQFNHEIDLKMNEVYMCADKVFQNGKLVSNAGHIAKHMYNQTRNPAIKAGEVFIATFEGVIFEDEVCKAVGVFKSEKKDNFFKINEDGKGLWVAVDQGINPHKLDKGCLILNRNFTQGFDVFTYEYGNADTDYWRDDFLSIVPRRNTYFQTKNFLNLCKDYVTDTLPNEFEMTKASQADYLNRSVEYFKQNEDFKVETFAKEVFQEPQMIKSFKNFKNTYQQEVNPDIDDAFSINFQAVKKQAKYFKSVIKLDKNFHVYVHGDNKMIEKGFDEEKGLNFYKIYYKQEN